MTNKFYSNHATAVDAVFFPVVPDSFMRRDSGDSLRSNLALLGTEWPEEVDRPLVSPHDRWSF